MAAWLFLFCLALVCSYIALHPLLLGQPAAGLDPSWVAVLGEAAERNLSVGEDIVFTSGPLSSVYTGYLDEDLFWVKLAARFVIVIALAWQLATLALDSGRPIVGIIMSLGLLLVIDERNAPAFALPMLTALVSITSPRFRVLGFILGVSATAIATLAKFSVFPIAVVAFVLADLVQAWRRRPPVSLLSYGLAVFAVFCIVEQPASFVPFLINSFSVMAGYSDAMALATGAAFELIGFLTLALVLLAVIIWTEVRAVIAGTAEWYAAAARALLISSYLVIVFKAGFVRHDLHSLIAWSGLAFAFLTYAVSAPREARSGGLPLSGLCAVGGFLTLLVVIPGILSFHRPSAWDSASRLASMAQQHLVEAKEFAAGPVAWLERRLADKQAAWASIRQQQPLPQLDGSVDVIPGLQSSVLANGLDYHPRPSFQDYGTYTQRLIELNRRFLLERGPDFLLFRPGSIDGRHPSLAEGPIWPDILRLYDPVSVADDLLLLRRRSQPLAESILGPEERVLARLGEAIALPSTQEPQFMTATIRKTWLGYVASFLFRPSLVFVEVTYTDGSTERYRLIPAIAEAGFLISPTIKLAADFVQVAGGRGGNHLPVVAQVKFTSGSLAAWLYRPDIDVVFRPVLSQLLLARALPQKLEEDVQAMSILHAFYKSVPETPLVAFIPEGLSVHAPITVAAELEHPASGIEIRYGIRDGAWQASPGTDGACFKISAKDTVLFERCLDPRVETSDRGEQRTHIPVLLQAGDKVIVETACRKHCEYDWTYLSFVAFDPLQH